MFNKINNGNRNVSKLKKKKKKTIKEQKKKDNKLRSLTDLQHSDKKYMTVS